MDEINFYSGDDDCAAWHFTAAGEAFADTSGRPCVVMAPGFASTRDTGGLVAYAEGFAAAGLHAVLFDYRGFAASGGSPRQLVSASRQRQDYHAAIAAARRLPGVDPERIVLWGISFSGGHVVRVAAEDARVAALSGWSFVTAAVIGVIGASGVVLVADRRGLLLGESVALSAVSFVVLGGVAVGGLPTPGAYGSFARGLVDGWADLLSSAPPADLTDQLRALPFTIAWLAAAVGGEIARHSRRPGLPAIGPLLALGLSLLFTVEERWLALLQGAGILAGTLALIAVATRSRRRSGTDADLDEDAIAVNRRRLALGAVVAVAAVVAAPMLGPRLPLADAHERFDLRRYQVPPFDPLAVPSPLVQLKASLKDERRDDVVFVVSGDTPIDRWPVAVMADYDGVVWTVADPEENARGTVFVPVDTQLPELDDPLPDGTTSVHHTVEIVDLGGSFLPLPGTATELVFPDDPDPRLNLQTGTVALPGGVPNGLTFDVTSSVIPTPTEAELATTTVTPVDRTEELKLLQPPVRNLAADLVEGRDQGWGQMAAIRDEFVNRGFYDATADTAPGHSEARIARMLEDPEQIVGYEEQYAAAAALMARVASLPTRVVVGYRVPEDAWQGGRAEVTAGDIAAWVELDTGEHGWVPVDVTPDRSRTPDPESQGATTEQIAIPNPPPPPPPPPDVQPPRQVDEEVDDDEIRAREPPLGVPRHERLGMGRRRHRDPRGRCSPCWRPSWWRGRRCADGADGAVGRRAGRSSGRGPRPSTGARNRGSAARPA